MTTVTKVSTVRYNDVVYVIAEVGRGIELTTATQHGLPLELHEEADALERKVARLQRQIHMLRQAAHMLENVSNLT